MTLALLVFVSTFSFTVDKHFCGSLLVDKAVFSEAKTCGMDQEAASEDSCCTNEKTQVEGQNELKTSFQSLDLDLTLFFSIFTHSNLFIFEGIPVPDIPFIHYSPPILVSDIHIRHQVFLI